MAGFFGLFNYEKEGPGISKNAPKKKAFIVFFETFFRNFWKFITINIVYNLISLPLITGGLAACGITNVTRNIARDKHSFGLSDFFDTLKKNWKQGLAAGIINTLVYIILAFDIYFFYTSEGGTLTTIGLGICLSILLIFTVMNYYIWTLIITFKFTLKQVYKNSFKFVFINLKGNLICFFGTLIVYAIYVAIGILLVNFLGLVLAVELILYFITFPAFKYLLIQFCAFPAIKKYIIDPYYRDHPEEDIEKRRDLGLEVVENKPVTENNGEDTEEEPENVFED